MPLTLRYVARSDVGLVREGNEDSGYAGPSLLVLADGMGGHAAGEVASQAAVDEIMNADLPATGDPDASIDALAVALQAANERIRRLAVEEPSREGMGTTATVLFWTGRALAVAHIGDSRAYLLRDGVLQQITQDHTYVQSLVDEGRLSRADARIHPAKSLVLKVLQGQAEVEPDFGTVECVAGDRLVVCSDGLSDVLTDEAIAAGLTDNPELDAAADELIRLALAGGAPDNVTVLLGEIVDLDTPPEPDDTIEAFLVGAASEASPSGPEQKPHRRGPAAAIRELLGTEDRDRDDDDPEAARYAPQPPRRFRWVRPVLIVAVIGLIGWVGLRLANDWVRSQYYVGDHAGDVAIYQGVSQELGPIRLSELNSVADGLPVAALPSLYRDQVADAIVAESRDDAERKVADLRDRACRAHLPEPAPAPTPTPDPAPPADPTSTPTTAPAAQAGASGTGPDGVIVGIAAGPTVAPTTTPTPNPTPAPTPQPEPDDPAAESTPDFPGLTCEAPS